MKDERANKLDFARSYLGVQVSDLANIGDKLVPRLPQVLIDRRATPEQFQSEYFTDEFKLDFISSVSALGQSISVLTNPDYDEFWKVTPTCDPSDASFRGPVGFRSKL